MEITKQQLFAMCLANEKQKVYNNITGTIGNYYKYEISQVAKSDKDGEYTHHEEICEIDFNCGDTGNYFKSVNISDCQLILKPVSEMSEERGQELLQPYWDMGWNINNQCNVDLLNMEINFDFQDLNPNTGEPNDIQNYRFPITVNEILILITHGYALSDKYFTNGWAVKERDVK